MRMRIFTCALAIIWGGFSASYAALPAINYNDQQTQTIGNQPKDSTIDGKSVKPQETDPNDKTLYDQYGRRITDAQGNPLRNPIPDDEPKPEPGKNFKAENDAFAAKMGYDPSKFDPNRNAEWVYNDNIKYMQEMGADKWARPWNKDRVNPYISYRNDIDMPKLMEGISVCERDTNLNSLGCNAESLFLSYLTTGVMPTDYTLASDNSLANAGQIQSILRTGMYENLFGTRYVGSDGRMDFSVCYSGQIGDYGKHYDFVFNDVKYGGSYANLNDLGGRANRGYWDMYSDSGQYVIAVLTNSTPYFEPEAAAKYYNSSRAADVDPRMDTEAMFGDKESKWTGVIQWLNQYEAKQVQSGEWAQKYRVPYMTRVNNLSGNYTIPQPKKY